MTFDKAESKKDIRKSRWLKSVYVLVILVIAVAVPSHLRISDLSFNSCDDHFTAGTVSMPPRPNDTHWCIIDLHKSSRAAKMHPQHFPHMAENLLPCWSWFRIKNATSNCGFVFLDGVKLDYGTPPNPWQKQLVDIMGCSVTYLDQNVVADRQRPLGPAERVQHSIELIYKEPRLGTIRYLHHPNDAVHLRRLVVSDEWIAQQCTIGKLHVGILQRTRSRSFLQLSALVDTVQEAFPNAIVNVTTLDTPSLVEQAQWFATKDVIFTPHGAALTNSIFLRPNSVIMQFFGPRFFWQSLDPLIEQAGSIALDWYPGKEVGGEDPRQTMAKNTYRQKILANKNNVSLSETAMRQAVQAVLETLHSVGKI